jgi:putative glutamine amidotransferase
MTPADTQLATTFRPRVGIPWRSSTDELKSKVNGLLGKTEDYLEAVKKVGGEAVLIPLKDEEERNRAIPAFDAFVLPGSGSDLDPARYRAIPHPKTHGADPDREKTDFAILEHAFASGKPVLAICYGCQLLNVYLKGSLIQDIPSQKLESIPHSTTRGEVEHQTSLVPGSRLATLSQTAMPRINSSHHQAIDRYDEKQLSVTAQSTDGIIEGVEWTGDSNWVVGVQWHPERMLKAGDAFSQRLFEDFVVAAKRARARETVAHKT